MAALRELGEAFLRVDAEAGGRTLAGQGEALTRGLTTALLRMLVLLVVERRTPGSAPLLGAPEGAWPRLLALSRALHAGAPEVAGLSLPRGGRLFDPHAHPFLEGRPAKSRGPMPPLADLPPISDAVVSQVLTHLAAGEAQAEDTGPDVDRIGALHEGLLGLEMQPDAAGGFALTSGVARRRAGAHYTSRSMARAIVARTLAPLLAEASTPEALLDLRICDPAMGAGAFLIETCHALAGALLGAWERTGTTPSLASESDLLAHAHALVAQRCLHGVDKDPLAVDIARISLGLLASAQGRPPPFVDHALRSGDAIVGLGPAQIVGLNPRPPRTPASKDAERVAEVAAAIDAAAAEAAAIRRAIRLGAPAASEALARADDLLVPARLLGDAALATFLGVDRRSRARTLAALPAAVARLLAGEPDPDLSARLAALRAQHLPLHWELEFPEVFRDRGGFDAFVGNPPWVAYAGRAAQPIATPLRDLYAALSPAFAGYRTLQGIFVHRAASLLRPGGRLGLVLPTSMSDLAGYDPVRRAHDALCAADEALPDFGDRAFDGVFQPSMGLLSTRRLGPPRPPREGLPSPAWQLARSDIDAVTAGVLERLEAFPRLPAHLFGERGYQTTAADTQKLATRPDEARAVALRAGGDVAPCLRRAPRFYCDPSTFEARFRAAQDWHTVRLLIRQTARFPIAALSDGLAFRNSILAGFADAQYSESFLLAYLNSTPVRWIHYQRQRDARQGMPQVKISHLRALPAPPPDHPAVEALSTLGHLLGARNEGITEAEQATLDSLAAQALSLDDAALALFRAWRAAIQPGVRLTHDAPAPEPDPPLPDPAP